MKENLKRIIDNMQAEIDSFKPGDSYIHGYVDCCGDYIEELKEIYESIR